MVRQISRSCGSYTGKMAKSDWYAIRVQNLGIEVSQGRMVQTGQVQSLRHQERTLNPRMLLHQRSLTTT
jgi:hypothetical protein